MALNRLVVKLILIALVDAVVIEREGNVNFNTSDELKSDTVSIEGESEDPNNAFNGVYTECLLHMSYTCIQKKTLQYLKELDGLTEIPVIGDYVKFVKLNNTDAKEDSDEEENLTKTSEELSLMIDKAVENFFDNHLIRFSALGKDIFLPQTEEFVGRKRRKGGGGGHGGGDDGGKKKMMMMAMMCMKMKLMMMVPAMMGMMGMMSFKGMMFSMMSFMISKMMLLMKILEKKAGGGGGGWNNDPGWASSGGGGAWMPAGGQDYGGGGGYDTNAQWNSRSIIEKEDKLRGIEKPVTYIKPATGYAIRNSKISLLKNINDEVVKANNKIDEAKSRRKRGLMDTLQNAYFYWASKVLGLAGYKQKHQNFPKFKIINGVRYIYYPLRPLHKVKAPKELPIATGNVKQNENTKPIVIAEDFNKGEIVEGVVESRMNRRKFHKMKDNISETVDDNPWQ